MTDRLDADRLLHLLTTGLRLLRQPCESAEVGRGPPQLQVRASLASAHAPDRLGESRTASDAWHTTTSPTAESSIIVRQARGIVTGETPHTASGPHPTVGVPPIVPSTKRHADSDVRYGPLSRLRILYLRSRVRRVTRCLVRQLQSVKEEQRN